MQSCACVYVCMWCSLSLSFFLCVSLYIQILWSNFFLFTVAEQLCAASRYNQHYIYIYIYIYILGFYLLNSWAVMMRDQRVVLFLLSLLLFQQCHQSANEIKIKSRIYKLANRVKFWFVTKVSVCREYAHVRNVCFSYFLWSKLNFEKKSIEVLWIWHLCIYDTYALVRCTSMYR